MSKTICLIIPPSCFLLDERVFLTLGILRVAACLENADHRVEMLDLSGIANYEDAARAHAVQSAASIFGVTATTPQMPAASKIAAVLRSVQPLAKLIIGGPHATLVHAAMRRERRYKIEGRGHRAIDTLANMFNVIVAGDGEQAIFEAIRSDAPKIVDGDNPNGSLFLTSKTLEMVPLPARHLIDVSSYHYSIDGERALSLIAQLGCPFACAFCGGRESPMLRRIRTRSTKSIVAEIRHLYTTYDVRGIMFYDDELNVNKQVVELMGAIAKLGIEFGVQFKLRGFVKAELFNDAQAAAMYAAGFRWLLVGFESGSPRILTNINKKATRDDNTRCLQIARKYGLKVKALMSLGHAGESRETICETRDWLLEQRPDDFDATIITTYPGTPYFDYAVETAPGIWTFTAPQTGDRLHATETDFCAGGNYYKGIPGEYVSHVFTDHVTTDDIVKLRDSLEGEVRAKLGIPYNAGAPGVRYEASMGMLPGFILRTST